MLEPNRSNVAEPVANHFPHGREHGQTGAHRDGLDRIPGPSVPHGGRLALRWAGDATATLSAELSRAPRIELSPSLQSDVEMLAVGAYSPLEGFLGERDFHSVVEHMRLADGTVWSLPIVLPVDEATARGLAPGTRVALTDDHGVLASLDVEEIYPYDKSEVARHVFRTLSEEHPGVARLQAQGSFLVSGPVRVLRRPDTVKYPEYHLDPIDTRRAFDARGWATVVAFQTRNPIHRAHEFIQKCALEIVEGLLVHPLVGETKGDDIPADLRMKCYTTLLQGYYRSERTMLSVFPATMRYAGPREALFHAIVRKNYGCTHFIVGRDHAGVGSFYGTYDAQQIFREFTAEELGITPLPFENTFFCKVCDGMASLKSCPHPEEQRVNLSGTKVREMLRRGECPPPEFTRPEVAEVLVEGLAETMRDGGGI